MSFGFQPASASHFGTRLLPVLRVSKLSFSFFPSIGCELSAVSFLSLTPFPATLTSPLQIAENPTTLSSAFATLTNRVKHKSFVCHSYKKHPGWGAAMFNFFVAQTSVCALLRQSTSERSEAKDPYELKDHSVPVTSHKSAVTASALSLPPATSHQSQITKSRRIHTSEKRTHNPFRIRTSKTQDLKPFRIRTYEKTGVGGPFHLSP